MISEFVGKEKTAKICGRYAIMEDPFVFSEIPDDTQLLIVDDLPNNFDFEKFFPVEDNDPGGVDLTFSIQIERKAEWTKTIHVPYLICIANHFNPKWLEHEDSFCRRFDVVEFPLSETESK